MDITKEESTLLETSGLDLWNCATNHLPSANDTRTVLYQIGYNMVVEAYKYLINKDINVLLKLLEMNIFVGSQCTGCLLLDEANDLLQSAKEWIQTVQDQVSRMEQQPIQIGTKFNQCQSDLLKALAELAARQGQWKEVQVYMKRINESLATQTKGPEETVVLLFHFCFHVAIELVTQRDWDQALHWILSFCSSTKGYIHCEESLLIRLAQLIGHTLLNRKNDLLDESHMYRLLAILDTCFENRRYRFDYHCAKIMVYASSASDYEDLEMALFDRMETMETMTEDTIQMTQRLGTLLLQLTGRISLNRIVGSINVFTQRCLATQSNDILFRHLYLFKLYIVSEWITHQTTIVQTPQYNITIKLMMEEMYLVKDRLTPDDLVCCQTLLWTVADTFFDNENYSGALVWYRQLWSLCLASLKDNPNASVLARKLASCNIQLGQHDTAKTYIETCLAETGTTAVALDYLLLLEINISLQDEIKAQGFTLDIMMSAAHLCYKNGHGNLLQTVLDHALVMNSDDQETHKRSLMTLFKWTIRFCVNDQYGSNTHSAGLLTNKDDILKYMQKGADYFAYLKDEPLSSVLQEHRHWLLRTGWNLALQFYGLGRDDAGEALFKITGKVICLILGEGPLTEQYISYLLICATSQLHATSFPQLTHHDQASICTDILALIDYLTGPSYELDAFVAIITLLKVQCYATLNDFDQAWNTLKKYGNQIDGSPDGLAIYERLASIIIQQEQCPPNVTKDILHTVSSLFHKHDRIDKWAKWNRLYLSMTMDGGDKDEAFDSLVQLAISLAQGTKYPEKEIHYLVIITWNEGVTRYQTSYGKRWCQLSHDLMPYLGSSYKVIKDQISHAYQLIESPLP
ncbi:hypothetical protein BC941DRAFT_476754 [Chlamydoabsidia padenii]|nr:hypothetical protein BC941DRAFT_476754 [Chlamydoabsidia padenii]